jgi:hypothetical protein
MIKRAEAITFVLLPPNLRCTAAADGKFQGGLFQQRNAVECIDWRKAKESNTVSLHTTQ